MITTPAKIPRADLTIRLSARQRHLFDQAAGNFSTAAWARDVLLRAAETFRTNKRQQEK